MSDLLNLLPNEDFLNVRAFILILGLFSAFFVFVIDMRDKFLDLTIERIFPESGFPQTYSQLKNNNFQGFRLLMARHRIFIEVRFWRSVQRVAYIVGAILIAGTIALVALRLTEAASNFSSSVSATLGVLAVYAKHRLVKLREQLQRLQA